MKKIVFALVMLLAFTLPQAYSSPMIIRPDIAPPYPELAGLASHQWYSVFLDGEGEASVGAKLQVFNAGKESLKNFTIEISGKQVRIIAALQELPSVQKQCVQWDEYCSQYAPDDICLTWEGNTCVSYHKPCIRQERKCLKYEEVRGYPYTYAPLEISKEVLSKSVKLTLSLANETMPQNSATVLIYYKVADVAEKSLGVWSFDFETLKWGFDTDNVRVSVNVDSGFVMEGIDARTEYRPAMFGAMESAAKISAAAPSQELSDFSSRIVYDYGWVRETKGLDPWESFHVEGEYAKSRFMLQKGVILLTVFIILAVLGGAIYGVRKLVVSKVKAGTPAMIIIAGFVGAIALIASWWLFIYVMNSISGWVSYGFSSIMGPLFLLVGLVWFVVCVFGPAVFVGIKTQSWGAGLLTLLSTILWLIILLVGLAIILSAITGGPPRIMPMMMSGVA